MSPPFIGLSLLLKVVSSDPAVRPDHPESLSWFHILHLSHTSTPGSWTRQAFLPRSAQVDDHGPPIPSSEVARQSGSATRPVDHISPGDWYASRWKRPSPVRRMTALMSSGITERLRERQAKHAGFGNSYRYRKG
jgi:hypothetical protein